jgi:hypothetical protein
MVMEATGVKQKHVAKACGISECTLRRAKARQSKFGDVEAGHKIQGRKTVFVPSLEDVISSSEPS